MSHTMNVVGVLRDAESVSRAMSDLEAHGFGRDDMRAIANGATDPEKLLNEIESLGVPREEGAGYEQQLRRGYVLVALETSEERADEAIAIIERYEPIDLDQPVTLSGSTTIVDESVVVGGGGRLRRYRRIPK